MTINIALKKISSRRNLVKEVPYEISDSVSTIGEFLDCLVEKCVCDYKERQENTVFLKALSKEEIEDKAFSGKVSFDVNYGENTPNLAEAKQTAREAFQDGLVVIFIDGIEQKCEKELGLKDLNSPITIKDGSNVLIVKMAFIC